jgi:hypothetical protein
VCEMLYRKEGMAATTEWAWRRIARDRGGVELWWGMERQLWVETVWRCKKGKWWKRSSFWVVGRIASREDQSNFWREGKADLDREVQNTQIGQGRFFELRLVVEFFRCTND